MSQIEGEPDVPPLVGIAGPLHSRVTQAISECSGRNAANPADFILGEFLTESLVIFTGTIAKGIAWYGRGEAPTPPRKPAKGQYNFGLPYGAGVEQLEQAQPMYAHEGCMPLTEKVRGLLLRYQATPEPRLADMLIALVKEEGEPLVPQAVDRLRKALKEDDELRLSWVSNIAMCFVDRLKGLNLRDTLRGEDLHRAANEAAEAFIQLLCSK